VCLSGRHPDPAPLHPDHASATCPSCCCVPSIYRPDPLRLCGVEAQLTPLGSSFPRLLLALALVQPPHQAPRSASTRHATALGYGSRREHATLLLERATSPTSHQTRSCPDVTGRHRLQPLSRTLMSAGRSSHPPIQLAPPQGPRAHQPPPRPVDPLPLPPL
jgi:hypothetical protein